MACSENKCKKFIDGKIKKNRSVFPILTGILIAILPKCPFCIAAYSSAIVLCSGNKIYNQAPDWTNFISIGLAVLTLLMILFNFRGKRTWYAVGLVIVGSALIIRTELFTGALEEYYFGALALLLGVWLNGSFLYFYKSLTKFVAVKLEGGSVLKEKVLND